MATFDTEHLEKICYGNQKLSFQNHYPLKPKSWQKKLVRAAKAMEFHYYSNVMCICEVKSSLSAEALRNCPNILNSISAV